MRTSIKTASVILVLTCLAQTAPAFAQDAADQASVENTPSRSANSLELATGADFSVGRYGAAVDTTVWSLPADVKAQLGRLRLQGSLAYVSIDGPGQIVGGVIVSSPDETETTSRSGIGDVNLSAAYRLTDEAGILPIIEIGGNVKLPTAKRTIGTGETDYSANVSLYKTVAQGTTVFGSVGYSWLGSPETYQLENGVTAYGGLNFRPASNDQNYGFSVAYREPVTAGRKGQAIVSPYMTYRVSGSFGFTLYGLAGLNDASPRVGGGVRLTLFR